MTEAAAEQTRSDVVLHQIAYSPASLAEIEPGFLVLDNLANPRPDWYEYWPIRQYLMSTALDEDSFYGFFSPKFGKKTGLSHETVAAFVRAHAPVADVILFSPQPDMGALFLNVFEQAEFFDPGSTETFAACLRRAGRDDNPSGFVMDSRQVAFSNFFVARPAFWRVWLALNEVLFEIAEEPSDALGAALRKPTLYDGGVQRKVFLVERMASYLLAAEPKWRSVRYNPFGFAWSATSLSARPLLSVISDALKLACREHGDGEYLAAYASIRAELQSNAGTVATGSFAQV